MSTNGVNLILRYWIVDNEDWRFGVTGRISGFKNNAAFLILCHRLPGSFGFCNFAAGFFVKILIVNIL